MIAPKLTVVLSAQPNADFPADRHRGSVQIAPHEVEVATLKEAIQVFLAFITEHNLGSGNLGAAAGLIKRDGVPLAKVALNGTLWQVDSTGNQTGKQYVRPRFGHVGEVVRFLRESADLTRNQLADATGNGVSASTIRNLETGRHTASAWTWRKLLAHPALRDLPRLAAESGLEMPIPVPVPGLGTPGGNTGGNAGGSGGGGGDDGGSSSGGDTEGNGGRT